MTERTMRIMIVVGLIWIGAGIVRLAFGNYVWGGIGIALGAALLLRVFAVRRKGEVV